MTEELREHRLRALFCAGVLLFNFPLIALWNRDALLLGVPLFPALLFVVWAVLIGVLASIVESSPAPGADDEPGAGASSTQPTPPA